MRTKYLSIILSTSDKDVILPSECNIPLPDLSTLVYDNGEEDVPQSNKLNDYGIGISIVKLTVMTIQKQ